MPEALKAAEMYEQGHSLPQIAAVIGRSRKTIATGLRQLGRQPRTPAEGYRAWLRLRGGKATPRQNVGLPVARKRT
jgi:transposase